MSAGVRIVPGRTPDDLAAAQRTTRAELSKLVRWVTVAAWGEVAQRTPVGATQAARGNYGVEMRGVGGSRPRGAVVNPIIYLDVLEDGRRKGRRPPPAQALVAWVGTKLGVESGPKRMRVAYLVARSIGREGTEGAHMIEEGWRVTKRQVKPRLRKAGYVITGKIGGRR